VGADDYVTKPFSPLELRARIKALLRRSSASEQTAFRFGSITIDLQRIEIRSGEERLDFTALEFKLMAVLVQNMGRVIGRDRLLDLVWGQDVVVTDRAIDTHIANIRKKLGSEGADLILTVRGLGYRFSG
jgi:DNA-binding response OmpR family regulator